MKAALSQFITQDLIKDGRTTLADDDNLLANGLVDSLGMVRLINFIEDTFDLEIPVEDMTVENFRSLTAMTAYLTRLKTLA